MKTILTNKSVIFMIVSSVMFALLGVFIKSIPSGIANTEIVFLRNLFAFLIIAPFFIIYPVKITYYRTIKLYGLKIFSGLAAMYCYYYAIKELPLVNAVLLNNTAPLFIPFVAIFLIREKFNLKNMVLLMLGFAGVAIILSEGLIFNTNMAIFIGLSAGLFLAISSVSVSAIRDKNSVVGIIFYFMLITTLASSIPVITNWQSPSYEQLFFIMSASLVTIIGAISSTQAFLCGSPNKLAALQFLTVPFSFIFGLWFWDEAVSTQFIIGAIIVIIASYFNIKNRFSTIGVEN